jgi:hypothetical protein
VLCSQKYSLLLQPPHTSPCGGHQPTTNGYRMVGMTIPVSSVVSRTKYRKEIQSLVQFRKAEPNVGVQSHGTIPPPPNAINRWTGDNIHVYKCPIICRDRSGCRPRHRLMSLGDRHTSAYQRLVPPPFPTRRIMLGMSSLSYIHPGCSDTKPGRAGFSGVLGTEAAYQRGRCDGMLQYGP